MSTPEAYAWIHAVLHDAACVTAATGVSVAEALASFGADPGVQVPLAEAYGTGDAGFVSVVEVAGGVVAVELNGFQGSLPETITSMSTGGVAASMFWNVNEDNAFSCARGGELLAGVDMYDAEVADEVELPDELRPLFAAAGSDDADLHATGMAMVEQFTGITISADLVAAIRTAHPIA